MQENEIIEEHITPETQPGQSPTEEKSNERPKLKRHGLKDEFKKKGDEFDEKQKPPMSKEDTIKFYEENLPFMKMQDEYEELIYNFNERKVRNLELQVRELEAIGYLGQWKAQQDEAKRRHDSEQKMKDEWDAMSDEEKEEYKHKAKANLRIMELQAKGSILYNGDNWNDIVAFVTGEDPVDVEPAYHENRFVFTIPDGQGGTVTLTIGSGQTLTRTEAGEFIVS